MNKVFLVGRLTNAPELRTTSGGLSVARMTVAVTRRFKREESDFINVVAWRGLADNCSKYLVKGQQVCVIGELRNDNYEDKDGKKQYRVEVHADDIEFLAKPGAGGGSSAPAKSNDDEMFSSEMGSVLMDDEELPF